MSKTGRVHVRVSAEQELMIARKAGQEGMKPSEWIRKVLARAASDGRCKRCRRVGLAYCRDCVEQVQAVKERAKAEALAESGCEPAGASDRRCERCKQVGMRYCPNCVDAVTGRNVKGEQTAAGAPGPSLPQDGVGEPAAGGRPGAEQGPPFDDARESDGSPVRSGEGIPTANGHVAEKADSLESGEEPGNQIGPGGDPSETA